MATTVSYLNWIDLFKSYSKSFPGKSCVFITLHDELKREQIKSTSEAFAEFSGTVDGSNLFISDYILLLFDDDMEAVEWTNEHDDGVWPFYAVCIKEGQCLTENT